MVVADLWGNRFVFLGELSRILHRLQHRDRFAKGVVQRFNLRLELPEASPRPPDDDSGDNCWQNPRADNKMNYVIQKAPPPPRL